MMMVMMIQGMRMFLTLCKHNVQQNAFCSHSLPPIQEYILQRQEQEQQLILSTETMNESNSLSRLFHWWLEKLLLREEYSRYILLLQQRWAKWDEKEGSLIHSFREWLTGWTIDSCQDRPRKKVDLDCLSLCVNSSTRKSSWMREADEVIGVRVTLSDFEGKVIHLRMSMEDLSKTRVSCLEKCGQDMKDDTRCYLRHLSQSHFEKLLSWCEVVNMLLELKSNHFATTISWWLSDEREIWQLYKRQHLAVGQSLPWLDLKGKVYLSQSVSSSIQEWMYRA